MSFRDVVSNHRLVVCVGTGGVGKTSLSAAIALAGALIGRNAVVLTIDPARALGHALGMRELGSNMARVEAAPSEGILGSLHAGMLEQANAWDAFIRRHSSSPVMEHAILANPFYRQLSRRFSGSTEYVALEELCRLHESGRYDLLVLDTPPAAHALDFLRAPDRIDRLLDPGNLQLFSHPFARRILRLLERATGKEAFGSVVELLSSLEGSFARVRERSRESRALVHSPRTAFVLVTGPAAEEIAGARELLAQMDELGARLAAVLQNRVHPLPGSGSANAERDADALAERLTAAGVAPTNVAWLSQTHRSQLAMARVEERGWRRVQEALPADVVRVRIPELLHDVHSLSDLGELGRLLLAS